jgi:hypothetical protein
MLAGIACAASGAGGMLVSGLNASGIVFLSIGSSSTPQAF